jgi:hypothetical protein
MKFKIFLALVLVLTLIGINYSYSQTVPKISLSLNKKTYNPGDKGILKITFKTDSETKIPKEPSIIVNISGTGITGTGVEDYSSYPSGDYLVPPVIKYDFQVSNDVESGTTINVSGTVKFGYCDYETGICKIGTKKINFKVKVK